MKGKDNYVFIESKHVGKKVNMYRISDRFHQEDKVHCRRRRSVANMASYAISSSLILVIHDNMIIGTNLIV
jgi:hypothetical protein